MLKFQPCGTALFLVTIWVLPKCMFVLKEVLPMLLFFLKSSVLSARVLASDGIKELQKKSIGFSKYVCRELATCPFELLLL